MRKIGVILSLLLLSGFYYGVKAQTVTGIWLNADKDAKIKIYKTDKGTLDGEIVWLKHPNNDKGKPKLDVKNTDKELRSQKVKGLVLLKGFEKDGDEYEDGSIYDPKSGKTYSCKMHLESQNKLYIRGYVGISLFGRTEYWIRTTLK